MLSEALRLIRVFHDLNQSDLAEQIEISRSYLSEIEGGKKEPSLELIKKYSVRFNIPVSSIMFFAENLDMDDGTVSKKVLKAKGVIANKIINFLLLIESKTEENEKKS